MAKKWLKPKVMNKEPKQLTLFELEQQQKLMPNKFCLHCVHRIRFELNEKSKKVQICCEMQPSKRSNSGYKTIRVTDKACVNYKES